MEKSLYKIKLADGRTFKVFCANRKQKQRLARLMVQGMGGVTEIIENGIHNIKQFELIITNQK